MASPRIICWGASTRGADVIRAAGRRPPGLCSRRGLVQRDAPPHFSFVLPKEKRAVHGPKRKALARSGAVALRARRGSAYRCKRRFGLAFGHAMAFCEVDTAVPWRMVRRASGCKNAFDLLLFPRVPLRYALPGVRRGRCPHRPVAEAPSTTRSAAAKREAGCIPDLPGPKVSLRAGRFRP